MPLVAYQVGLVDDSQEPPRLFGGECASCGRHFFPFQTYGCEGCGAHGGQLRPIVLPARGTVLAATAVGHWRGRWLESPRIVARVQLAPDLEVRGRVDAHDPPAPGTEVVGVLAPCEDASAEDASGEDALRELRFAPVRP